MLWMGRTWGGRYTRTVLAVAATVAVAGGGGVWGPQVIGGGGGSTPPAGTANIWVDTNGGTCSDSATAVAYVDAAACGSLDAANDTCESGDLVLVQSGTYPAATITGSNGRGATDCTMRAVTAAGPVFGTSIDNDGPISFDMNDSGAGHLTLDGFATTIVSSWSNAAHGGTNNRGRIDISGTDVTIQNMTIGTVNTNGTSVVIQDSDVGEFWAGIYLVGDQIIFRRNYLHDFNDTVDNHNECVRAFQGDNITIDSNRINHCPVFSFLIKPSNGSVGTWLIQNNVIGPDDDQGLKITNSDTPQGCGPITVRNNTFVTGSGGVFTENACNTGGNPVITGNITVGACTTGFFTFNLFASGGPCGTGNVSGSAAYVNEGADNYHIGSSSAARGAGNASNFPSTDKDGVTRSSPPDAGAYQYVP